MSRGIVLGDIMHIAPKFDNIQRNMLWNTWKGQASGENNLGFPTGDAWREYQRRLCEDLGVGRSDP